MKTPVGRLTSRAPKRRVVVAWLLVVALDVAGAGRARADDRPGSFGLSLAIDGEGSFVDPTLKSVTVDAVVAGSPAARAGIAPQDRIVAVEGRPVAGARARELQPDLKRNVGETVHLRLARPGGDEYDATMIAAPKPTPP